VTLPVVWTLRARDRLTEIVKYIAERNPTAARSLKAAIEGAPQATNDAFLDRSAGADIGPLLCLPDNACEFESQRVMSSGDGGKCHLPVMNITAASTTIPVRMPESRISAGIGSADQ
jgi:hypothetical protein